MTDIVYFEDLAVGDEWHSEARQINEAEVSSFAHLTGDFDPLHMDESFAERTPFRKRIAHGVLGLAMLAGLGSENPRVETVALVGIEDWKFHHPIYFGDTVYAQNTIIALAGNGRRRGRVTWHRQLINQDDCVVQEGTMITLVASRAGSHYPDLQSTSSESGQG
ncbi:MAG: dehydratase [Blastopirellula sp.]|nr:dehydratase [Blastopirellula sp.]